MIIKKIAVMTAAAVALVAAHIDSSFAQSYATSEVIVKFKDGGPLKASRSAAVQNLALSVKKVSPFSGVTTMRIGNGATVSEAIAALSQDPTVEYAEPNYIVHALDTVPNDPQWSSLWGMAIIDAPRAWDTARGSAAITVGVIDTGIDYTHLDLASNIWTNPAEVPGNGIDEDGNGYVDDVHGINCIAGNGDPMDDNEHGTHVSGTIGAAGNNGLGVVGVNWTVRIAGLKFLDSSGSGYISDAEECLRYAIAKGFKITSNSWGGGSKSTAFENAIKDANAAGQLFVAAAGNSGRNTDSTANWPSNYNLANVISVCATDSSDTTAYFSNFGTSTVDLCAPGVDINSTVPGGGYSGNTFSGTSMAAPHVAGVAALVLSTNPGLGVTQLRSRILNSVDVVSSLASKVSTGGRLNAWRSVTNTPDPAYNTDWDSDGVPNVSGNCPRKANSNQADLDGDGVGNSCESVCGAGSSNTEATSASAMGPYTLPLAVVIGLRAIRARRASRA